MLNFDPQYHRQFVIDELRRLIPEGSFASRVWRALGADLHLRLVDWPFDESEVEFSSLFPVEELFLWATRDGGLDPAWLARDDDAYVDDDGKLIPESVSPKFSAVEQLAAYGLWLATSEFCSVGTLADEGHNVNGRTREQVIAHHCECVMLAQQALSYAQRLMLGTPLSADEIEKARSLDYSRLGKAGAQKRHAPNSRLREWAIALYLKGQDDGTPWRSANHAAHALKDRVIAHGRTIGSSLTDSNGQRTIAEWFRKSG